MSAPAHTTGDRLDRVVKGQSVQLDPIVLGAPTPTTGWVQVTGVVQDAGGVVLVFADDTSFTGDPARLVRIGWA